MAIYPTSPCDETFISVFQKSVGNIMSTVFFFLYLNNSFQSLFLSHETNLFGFIILSFGCFKVGNIFQIVPTEFSPEMIKPPEPPVPPTPPPPEPQESEEAMEELVKAEWSPVLSTSQDKQSAEEVMQMKIAERKAEREQRRQLKEKKRLEKEKRRKERESKRQMKTKRKTENMIKVK